MIFADLVIHIIRWIFSYQIKIPLSEKNGSVFAKLTPITLISDALTAVSPFKFLGSKTLIPHSWNPFAVRIAMSFPLMVKS